MERHDCGYRLAVPRAAVDAHRFEAGARAGRLAFDACDYHRATTVLAESLALFRGDPLADVPSEALEPERERLRGLRLAALENRIEADLALGRHQAVVSELEVLAAAEPLRERLLWLLMLALYRSGRQADALARYRAARRYYREELGLEPGPELLALERRILRQDSSLTPGAAPEVHVPRPPSRFIGRAAEIEEVRDLLRRHDVRLVTVTGAGGIGKTRLALEAAHAAAPAFAETRLVELAPLMEAGLLEATIARVLGSDSVVDAVRDRRLLLVLDNVEHLLAGVREIGGYLRACPNLTILATSRERLRLTGEHVYELDPLDAADAVALFDDRARAVSRQFRHSAAVNALCAGLDHMPLAIELAAARLDELGMNELLAAWARAVDLAAEGARDADDRQRTLDATIGWSYDLLGRDERAAFRQASVFRGGFTSEAARAVAGAREDTLEALARKSLILERVGRYRLLEPVRQFAAARLEPGELEAAERRHADHFAAVCCAHGPTVTYDRAGASEALRMLETDFANVRAAVRWARRYDRHLHARLVWALMIFWYESGRVSDALREVRAALDHEDELLPPERAGVQLAAALTYGNGADFDRARAHGMQAFATYQAIGDEHGVAHALAAMSSTYAMTDVDRSLEAMDDAIAAARRAGNIDIERFMLVNVAYTAVVAGDTERADGYLAEADAAGGPGPLSAANVPTIRAIVETAKKRWDAAAAALEREYELLKVHPWAPGILFYVLQEAVLALETGDPGTSATLLGATIAGLDASGLSVDGDPMTRVYVARLTSELPLRLGRDTFEHASREGRGLNVDEAMELARGRRLARADAAQRDLTAA